MSSRIELDFKVLTGYEDIMQARFETPEANAFLTMYNLQNNKAFNGTVREVLERDGQEAFLDTMNEFVQRSWNNIKGLFSDKEKEINEEIEKNYKGGLKAFKDMTIGDAITQIKKTREVCLLNFNQNSEWVRTAVDKSKKGKDELKKYLLNEIDTTLLEISKKENQDLYYDRIQKSTEDAVFSLVLRKRWIMNLKKQFADIRVNKVVMRALDDLGIDLGKMKSLEDRIGKLHQKYVSVDQNKSNILIIKRSNIIPESFALKEDLRPWVFNTMGYFESLWSETSNLPPSSIVSLRGTEWSVGTLRSALWLIFLFFEGIVDAYGDFVKEVNHYLQKASYMICGFSKELSDILAD